MRAAARLEGGHWNVLAKALTSACIVTLALKEKWLKIFGFGRCLCMHYFEVCFYWFARRSYCTFDYGAYDYHDAKKKLFTYA